MKNGGYTLEGVDCVWRRPKNLQRLNSIEIYYYKDNSPYYCINYRFHLIDLMFWQNILNMTLTNIPHYFCTDTITQKKLILTNFLQVDPAIFVEHVDNGESWIFNFTLFSKDPMIIYSNISTIFFLQKGEWNNMNLSIEKNTWPN